MGHCHPVLRHPVAVAESRELHDAFAFPFMIMLEGDIFRLLECQKAVLCHNQTGRVESLLSSLLQSD